MYAAAAGITTGVFHVIVHDRRAPHAIAFIAFTGKERGSIGPVYEATSDGKLSLLSPLPEWIELEALELASHLR